MYWNFPLDVLWLLAGVSLVLREMFVGPIALNTGLTPAKPCGVWFTIAIWTKPRLALAHLRIFSSPRCWSNLGLVTSGGTSHCKNFLLFSSCLTTLSQTVAGSATQYWAGRSTRYTRTPWCQITHPKLLAPSQTITRPELPSCEIRTHPEGSQRSVYS